MAKLDTLFRFNGTFKGVTHVQSRLYPPHLRAKRGTHSKAEINDTLAESSSTLVRSNPFAKVIFDVLKPYCKNFKDGSLWSRLVSFCWNQLKSSNTINIQGLAGFELHAAHSLGSIASFNEKFSINEDRSVIKISLEGRAAPYFKKIKNYQRLPVHSDRDLFQ